MRRLPRALRWRGQSPDLNPAETGRRAQALNGTRGSHTWKPPSHPTPGGFLAHREFQSTTYPKPGPRNECWVGCQKAWVLVPTLLPARWLDHDSETLCPSLTQMPSTAHLCRAGLQALSVVLKASCPGLPLHFPVSRGAGLGSCQGHSVINQQV